MSGRIGYGLVRDKNGRPRIDDVSNLHPALIAMLTDEERLELGIWSGPLARDAQGTKRLEKTDSGYIALDPLVAVSEIYDGSTRYQLPSRFDAPVGVVIKLEI